ncbi:DUF4236 domain-containing protein [Desulfurispira natronophila]|uniref:Tetratricopeptide (TPR) repeat protein n=1 Tax=Desulfurispira natronophila TaxID=682562 RepID=A0A7W7Y3Y3_9BACT|nr:DUF4236 domain-containing protein [Desulfurispira natronophila]MBB5021372.1 tetratricopeptide (TPR) repeat protein [Desulfurispira natronophila]
MAIRFWRRIRIAPGITLNLSKRGGSLSLGRRGARVTFGRRGKRATVGIPGTGLSYSRQYPHGSSSQRSKRTSTEASRPERISSAEHLKLSILQRIFTPAAEKAFVYACREVIEGRIEAALPWLEKATSQADGAYLAGAVHMNLKNLEQASRCLQSAASNHTSLGKLFSKYEVEGTVYLSITNEVSVPIEPNQRGVLLGLAEIYQLQQRHDEALDILQQLRQLHPGDLEIRLSLAELLLSGESPEKQSAQQVFELIGDISNESEINAALMLYKGRALRILELPTAARNTLTPALRRKKDRSKRLLLTLRYERALVYQELGQNSRYRSELEKIYATSSDYADVAHRLGITL